MPKAEVGSTKYIANKMKSKGLQRLRWYCQICAKQCRDENGFKQHTLSEGHVRAMLLVGEDARKHIGDFSRQFQRDFVQLLRTAHGEKMVHLNHFYQEYIRDKEHVHMNATKWPSLTEFAKHLGREGICRVEEGERGLEIRWVDDSAEAIRRREDIRKKDRLAKGDEDVESRMLEQQIRRAKEAERSKKVAEEAELSEQHRPLEDGGEGADQPIEPIRLSGFSLKAKAQPKPSESAADSEETSSAPVPISTFSSTAQAQDRRTSTDNATATAVVAQQAPQDLTALEDQAPPQPQQPSKISLSSSATLKKKPTNPLAAKKNPFAKPKALATTAAAPEPEKKMSNAERIMKEEMERMGRKRMAGGSGSGDGGGFSKRPRLG